MMQALKVAPLFAVLAFASPASAESDARAVEAMRLFKAFCVVTEGSSAKANLVLGVTNPIAAKLPDAVVTGIYGVPGGLGWAIRSPSDGIFLLGYNPAGICEVRIAEAAEGSVVAAYEALVGELAGNAEPTVGQSRKQGDATLTFRSAQLKSSGRTSAIALTSSDRRIGEHQHLITFAFVKPQN
ncbi:hypothetical protein GVO57_05010 [Sphingomonas changnyeongensis]|uniref:Uncharacterized protein n=1 Tax=Sphingomonas changnyeongensis TaxID=2698679 RepID=A0A7Z2NVN0_9SPHN|nr:hypothetical protein [Sphingomonas changnyeongensis]QHL90311.1 hypothetical protein GVO57_05010 [Sphingomonas changnyeongensis]